MLVMKHETLAGITKAFEMEESNLNEKADRT